MDTRTKIIDRSSIPAQGARLVSGYFDPLTAAALASLERLRAETPGPLVAVITDPENPVLPARARAELVAALALIDYVVIGGPADHHLESEHDSLYRDLVAHAARRQQA